MERAESGGGHPVHVLAYSFHRRTSCRLAEEISHRVVVGPRSRQPPHVADEVPAGGGPDGPNLAVLGKERANRCTSRLLRRRSREVGEQFEGILSMVNGIKTQMDEINSSVEVVAAGAGNIVTAVDSIDGISRKTSENTQTISAATQEQSASNEEIAAASQSLANMATDMQTAIGQFKL